MPWRSPSRSRYAMRTSTRPADTDSPMNRAAPTRDLGSGSIATRSGSVITSSAQPSSMLSPSGYRSAREPMYAADSSSQLIVPLTSPMYYLVVHMTFAAVARRCDISGMTGSIVTVARLGIGKDDASVTPVSSPHVPQYGLVSTPGPIPAGSVRPRQGTAARPSREWWSRCPAEATARPPARDQAAAGATTSSHGRSRVGHLRLLGR